MGAAGLFGVWFVAFATPSTRRLLGGVAVRTVALRRWSAAATRPRVMVIGQVTGAASAAVVRATSPHQDAIAATYAISAGRARLEPRTRAPGLRRNHTVQGPSTKGRTKFEATTAHRPRLAAGLALLGLLPSPEVVIPIILVRRRRVDQRTRRWSDEPRAARGSRAAASGSGWPCVW